MKSEERQTHSLINSVIMVTDRFISTANNERDEGVVLVETYSDLNKLKNEALLLRKALDDAE